MGDITKRVTKKNKDLESTLPLTISAQHGLVDQVTYFNKQVASKNISNYYLLEKGDFAYNKSYSRGYPWGVVKRLDKYTKGVLSTLYITFRPTLINSDFLLSYYATDRWHKEVAKRATEGARNHGLLNISAIDFLDTDLIIPENKEEQIKIGNFLKSLENILHLHQRKYDALLQLKEAYLQNLFPSKGESVPKVRFANFSGDWEQRKLGELAPLRGGFAFQSSLFKKSGIPIVRISNILSNESVGGKFVYYEEIEKDCTFTLPHKSAIIAMSGATTGKVAVLINKDNKKVYQNQRVGYFSKTGMINYLFLSVLIKTSVFTRQLNSVLVAGAQPNISVKEIDDFEFLIPENKEEQKRIGQLINVINQEIDLYQLKIEKLNDLKNSYFQRIFI